MKEYIETKDDLRLKYSGGIVQYKGNPFYIRDFTGPTDDMVIVGSAKNNGTFTEVHMNDPDLDLSPKKRGCINLGSTVVVFNTRKTINGTDKFKRVLHQGNTEIFDPFKEERKLIRSHPVKFNDHGLITAFFKNSYLEAKDALESVEAYKKLGAAFSSEYYFGIKYRPDSIMLFKRNFMIGRVNKGLILLKQPAHHYYEELSEFGLSVKKV